MSRKHPRYREATPRDFRGPPEAMALPTAPIRPRAVFDAAALAAVPAEAIRAIAIGMAARCADIARVGLAAKFPSEPAIFDALYGETLKDEAFDYLCRKAPAPDAWWNYCRDLGSFEPWPDYFNLRGSLAEQPLLAQITFRAICAAVPPLYKALMVSKAIAESEAKAAARKPQPSPAQRPGSLIDERTTGFAERSFANERVREDE